MLYRKCACGCGRWIGVKHKNHKYIDNSHRNRHLRAIKSGKEVKSREQVPVEYCSLTPGQRWEIMTLAQIDRECKRLSMSYGVLQSAYYNGALPEDFGGEIL